MPHKDPQAFRVYQREYKRRRNRAQRRNLGAASYAPREIPVPKKFQPESTKVNPERPSI